ncbi:alpha/beta hydrolase [Steroidobacter agaridevorans]|uniref:Alpha/beta hydrolase n=1 Tax=Steroidobacter agaridevorans TaxID=2695856 RepID=A0A829YI99_9GAMM|nr:alpha/beta hydrolase [Steroidobacter agaridevorans]GFE82551.1 alpha/beta hydrolase [Steroidobacter agaridevorans]GFE85132.1 alpha/beta hydrolase [Steroidobacter agaridevorans]
MKRILAPALAAMALMTSSLPAMADSQPAAPTVQAPDKSGRIAMNGINYYYEIRGKGEPLLLLHGGLGSGDMFAPLLPTLTKQRQVVLVDLQGHGRTELGTRKFSLEAMGNDMNGLLQKLGYKQIDVLGYSMGGGVGFRLAVQHPDMVRRLVLVSAGYASDGFYPEILAQQGQVNAEAFQYMKDTPMYKGYVAVAPKPDDFPRLLDTIGGFMKQGYDYSADVAKLKMPVMLVFGDSDMYRPEHVIKFYQLLGGGLKDAGWMRENLSQNRLAILPNHTHYDIFLAPELVSTTLPFLNGDTKASAWQ